MSTSTKLAARKVRGGRISGMLVLAHMNTAKWQRMDNQRRQQAVQCPGGYEIQNVQHVLSGECEYMEESLPHMYLAVNEILQSEGESVQWPWLLAQYINLRVNKCGYLTFCPKIKNLWI